jgi:hypothetical protein
MTIRKRTAPPARLADRPPTGDPTADLATRLLRELRDPPRLSPAADARIDRRVAALSRPVPVRRWRWPATAVGAAVLLVGGAVTAKYQPAPVRRLLSAFRPTPRVSPPVRTPHAEPPPAPPRAEPPPAPPPPAPRTATPRAERPHLALRVPAPPRPAPPAPAPAPPPEPGLGEESALLGRALAQLRRGGDPAGALATLDEYETRFPRGAMAFDALAARVETLVKLGRKDAALARLDGVGAGKLAQSPTLRVLRGELRAGAGRLDEAIADFEPALASGASRGDLLERALWGRGSCRARRGDTAGARADLERYLELYPKGRFAGEARRVLGR